MELVLVQELRYVKDLRKNSFILHRKLLVHYHVVKVKTHDLRHVVGPLKGALHHYSVPVKIHVPVQI